MAYCLSYLKTSNGFPIKQPWRDCNVFTKRETSNKSSKVPASSQAYPFPKISKLNFFFFK